jgi:hypothetical protein
MTERDESEETKQPFTSRDPLPHSLQLLLVGVNPLTPAPPAWTGPWAFLSWTRAPPTLLHPWASECFMHCPSYLTTQRADKAQGPGLFFSAGYIYSQKAILKTKSAKIACFLRFSKAIIWPVLKKKSPNFSIHGSSRWANDVMKLMKIYPTFFLFFFFFSKWKPYLPTYLQEGKSVKGEKRTQLPSF